MTQGNDTFVLFTTPDKRFTTYCSVRTHAYARKGYFCSVIIEMIGNEIQ